MNTEPRKGEHGNVVKMYGAATNIRNLKHLESNLLAERRKDEFLAMLAHELRNPLSTVRHGISVRKITRQTDSEVSDLLGMMDKQITHLVRMIDDLLDLSRVNRGKIELKMEWLEIGKLIQDSFYAIQPCFENSHKTLHTPLILLGLFLKGDATRLSQAVTNLLTNSLKYTGDDGQVWVSVGVQGNEAVIRVKDNGIGLTPEQQTSVFDLFVQDDNSLARTKGGLGLGLILVKRLVEMHGGRVEARSTGVGKGSEFRIYLPLPDSSEHAATASEDVKPLTTSQPKILLIDDMTDIAEITSMILKRKGYHVDVRHNRRDGAEAVELLEPQVVLCDIGMPRLDGYQTAKLIRQGLWGQNTVIIALSGYGQAEDKRNASEAGFDGHLTKPVDINELEMLIAKLTN